MDYIFIALIIWVINLMALGLAKFLENTLFG